MNATGKPFVKGKSPNPGGRPKGYPEFRELCRSKTPRAVAALLRALKVENTRVPAAKVLLEFGWGRAQQSVSVEHTFSEMTDEQLEAKLQALTAKEEAAQELDS